MLRFCLLLPLLTLPSAAADLASWRAAGPPASAGIALVRGDDAAWKIETVQGASVAAITPVADYYRRARVLVRVDKPVPGRAWLVVTHFDRGYGLIGISGHINVSNNWASRAC